VEFREVSKRFRIQEGRTLQEFLPALAKGKGWAPPFYALRDLSFALCQGETVGIVGRNGSGKSTILKLIAGVMVPDGGEVSVSGRVCPLIELGAGFHPDLTGRENVHLNASLLGLSNREVRRRFAEIVEFAELADFMDTPAKRYSSGMYVRLTFAVAVHCEPDILLVDEALAVGDAHFQKKCLTRMADIQRRGVTIVFVSHSLDLVQSFCNRVLVIDGGRPVAEGEPPKMVKLYSELLAG